MSGAEDRFNPCAAAAGDPAELAELATMRMPYGTYKGRLLIDLPERYVVWYAGQGFPPGKLGRMLHTLHEIKANGLEYLFEPLRRGHRFP